MDGELSAWLGKGNSAASQASRNGEITLLEENAGDDEGHNREL